MNEAAASELTRPREAEFGAVYAALRAQIFSLCLHLTQVRADAEDALQDTFLAVHRALKDFRGEAELKTWVYRIAIRSALARRARSRRHAGLELSTATEDPRPGVEASVAARLEAQRLATAMGRLSADHRAVLSLFAVDGLSHSEIAQVLGIKEGTVWSRLHLARKKLTELLR